MKKMWIACMLALFLTMPVAAKSQKRLDPTDATSAEMTTKRETHPYAISAHDKISIQTYYRQQAHQERHRDDLKKGKGKKRKGLPPGLQKKLDRGGSLPPGWQRKLNRGDVMPYEAYEYADPIPQALSETLPQQPEGTELIRAEERIFRIIKSTREILDVLDIRF